MSYKIFFYLENTFLLINNYFLDIKKILCYLINEIKSKIINVKW